MPKDPYGWTIFCDDIRQEVGGKMSFMGIYRGSLVVHDQFPVSLAKFGLAVHYVVDFKDDHLEDVHVGVFLPGDADDAPTVRATIPLKQLINAEVSPASEGDRVRVFHAHIVLAPFTLKEKGVVRVRAQSADRITKLGTLRIEQKLPVDDGRPKSSD